MLVIALKDREKDVQLKVARAIGATAGHCKDEEAIIDAIRALVVAMESPEKTVRLESLRALGEISQVLEDRKAIQFLEQLQDAVSVAKRAGLDEAEPDAVMRMRRAVEALRAMERAQLIDRFLQSKSAVFVAAILLPYLLWIVVLRCMLLRWCPLRVLRWGESLDGLSLELPLGLGKITVPIGWLLLFRVFRYHKQTLDAWVKSHIEMARENFSRIETVREREIFVDVPGRYNDEVVPTVNPKILMEDFVSQGRRACLLIHGEGGSGKTSLGCQIGRWATSPRSDERIFEHLAIPVLIEHELDDEAVPQGPKRFGEAIRGTLQALVGTPKPISENLVLALLRNQRVLVIVDHLSEMSDKTRDQIRPAAADFPASALVVTSRLKETLGSVPKSTLEPIRIEADRLSAFVDGYLTKKEKRADLRDPDFFEACRRLSDVVGERGVTVLLASLFLDQFTSTMDGSASSKLPDNVPELMLRYIEELLPSDSDGETIRGVQHDAKVAAWVCVRDAFRPRAVDRSKVLDELGEDDATNRLARLETTLGILRTEGASHDKVRYGLDPLGEYLAALHITERYKRNSGHWRAFVQKASKMKSDSPSVSEFVAAVKDCCKISQWVVPNEILEELDRIAAL